MACCRLSCMICLLDAECILGLFRMSGFSVSCFLFVPHLPLFFGFTCTAQLVFSDLVPGPLHIDPCLYWTCRVTHRKLLCKGGKQANPGVDTARAYRLQSICKNDEYEYFFCTSRAPGQNISTGKDNYGRGGG